MATDITLHCLLCETQATVPVEPPPGWKLDGGAEDIEGNLCPDHAGVDEFRRSQCPGCVACWGVGCPLFRSFAYSDKTITPDDLAQIRSGVCPARVNGTLTTNISPQGVDIRAVDLSEPSTTAAGEALANAIEAYMERYA